MINRKLIFFILVTLALNCQGQVMPAPGAKLNYNQVMFEYEKVKEAGIYLVQVAEGTSVSAFNHPQVEQKDSATATMIGNLRFGKKYQWRYAGLIPGRKPEWHGPYNFEIVKDTILEKKLVNLVVTKNDSASNAGGLLVIDATHSIVDRYGKLVWYLPKINWHSELGTTTKIVNRQSVKTITRATTPVIFDLRLTSAGTITYLSDSNAQECNLDGRLLWKAPNDGKVSGFEGEHYNHDFKRLSNGDYMVLGNELWHPLQPQDYDTTRGHRKFADRRYFNGREYAKVEAGTVIEYDKQGNVVWNWNSYNYLEYDPLRPKIRNQHIEYPLKAHINAFSVDKKNEFVYVGFRDICRIVKVEKSTGKVVDSWGLRLYFGGANHPVGLHQQHDANILDDGNIAVFNSNDYPGADSIPAAVIISQQPADSNNIIWQFNCRLDSPERQESRNGGNVDQLKNGNLLVCTGTTDRIFEVTKDKNVVWQAELIGVIKDSITYLHRLYRAHYTSSLYPCYFVFETDLDTVTKKSPGFNIRVFNKGSENDLYDIKIVAGSFIKQFITDTIAPGRSSTYAISSIKNLSKDDRIELCISSQTNPEFVRKSWITVQ
jgi:hypothetical protein